MLGTGNDQIIHQYKENSMRVKMLRTVMFEEELYPLDQVVEISQATAAALGDSVEVLEVDDDSDADIDTKAMKAKKNKMMTPEMAQTKDV
jgi:hypothetical protein